jgi:hypothetical protein
VAQSRCGHEGGPDSLRQLLVIAPAMVSTKTERGCELTWPFDPASEARFIGPERVSGDE